MNQFKCEKCKRVHNRSRKCLYCGASAKYQKAVIQPPAAKVLIKATQLELPINSPAPLLIAEQVTQ